MSLGRFSVAVIGAYIAFLPLLQILLPLKAARIAPTQAAAFLGAVAAVGAVAAGIANVVVGWLSDRTRSRLGRRRPWILAGLAGVIASYAAIWQAQTAVALIVAFALFQVMFNMLFSPLLAIVSDRISPERRGWVSALMGLGKPIGTIVGTVVIGTLLAEEGERFIVLGFMVFAAILPFVVTLGPDPVFATAPSDPIEVHTHRWLSRNFLLVWISRVCIVMAFTVAQLYLLFYLEAIIPGASPRAAERALTLLAVIFGTFSAAAGTVAGKVSDASGHRKPFVLGSAVVIAIAMSALVIASSLPFAIAAYALFAAGAGVHAVVEFAMVVDILPSRDRAARDLGILNLSYVAPQIIAPLAVTWIVLIPGSTIQWAFAAAAVAAAAGAVAIAFLRAVK